MPNDNSSTTKQDILAGYTNPSSSTSQDSVAIPLDEPDKAEPDAPSLSLNQSDDSAPIPSIYPEVARRISESKNVLIALSSNPSVDELATAIGLSIYLDKLGKRATAIYSGKTPNALEFLKPENTFEPSADTLQDFVIALSKEKADHLRYKLDGNFVKIYITPYRSRISEDDLEFSYGDYNVDLVFALDVASGADLDSALREHGRIMHDAAIINVTTGSPNKFGEIEWSDRSASSISEMIAKMLYTVDSDVKIGREEATAFLTGIIAATNRFSDANTTPETMRVASLLMESGANQQLVSRNITPDVSNKLIGLSNNYNSRTKKDPTNLNVGHKSLIEDEEKPKEPVKRDFSSTSDKPTAPDKPTIFEESTSPDNSTIPEESTSPDNSTIPEGSTSLDKSTIPEKPTAPDKPTVPEKPIIPDDLKAVAESLSHAGAETMPELSKKPLEINNDKPSSTKDADAKSISFTTGPLEDPFTHKADNHPEVESHRIDSLVDSFIENKEKSQEEDKTNSEKDITNGPRNPEVSLPPVDTTPVNPANLHAPSVPSRPEINGVPDISYMPMPGDEVLPPPPTPPIDQVSLDNPVPPSITPPSPAPTKPTETVAPASNTAKFSLPSSDSSPLPKDGSASTPLGNQPAMQDQVHVSQASDPGAFKIPGFHS